MTAREYETLYILKPDIGDDRGPKVLEKVTKAIERQKGLLLGHEEWGKKKLSYDIAKGPKGVYVQIGYCGGGGLVNEVERELRLDDAVIRHFTLKIADAVDAETRQKEYATTKRVRREAPEEDERGGDRDDRGGYGGGYGDRDREDRGGYGARDFGDDERGGGGGGAARGGAAPAGADAAGDDDDES